MEKSITLETAQNVAAASGFTVRHSDNDETTYCGFVVSRVMGATRYQEYAERDTRAALDAAISKLRDRLPFTPRCANCGYSADDLYADAANTIPDEIDPICCEVPEEN